MRLGRAPPAGRCGASAASPATGPPRPAARTRAAVYMLLDPSTAAVKRLKVTSTHTHSVNSRSNMRPPLSYDLAAAG